MNSAHKSWFVYESSVFKLLVMRFYHWSPLSSLKCIVPWHYSRGALSTEDIEQFSRHKQNATNEDRQSCWFSPENSYLLHLVLCWLTSIASHRLSLRSLCAVDGMGAKCWWFLHREEHLNSRPLSGQSAHQDQTQLDSIFLVCSCTTTMLPSILLYAALRRPVGFFKLI